MALRRSRASALLVAVAALVGGCVGTSANGHGYVTGTGPPADDWRTEYVSRTDHPHSDLVALWQAVLWADGYLGRAEVTCRFDARTVRATRIWQSNHGINADGIVGPQTFGTAGRALALRKGLVVYRGERYVMPFRRGRDGRYYVESNGHYEPVTRNRATLSVCR
jgi:Putative peptidoglycan binding domain